MVQIENEYGFQKACDKVHLNWLRDLTRKYLGYDVILYTTDNPIDSSVSSCRETWFIRKFWLTYWIKLNFQLECGIIDKVLATVDFGVGVDPAIPFGKLKSLRPKGPLVNSEFYTGFFDVWTVKHEVRSTRDVSVSVQLNCQCRWQISFSSLRLLKVWKDF